MPGDHAIEFPLTILAALDGRPTHVGRHISVQPLLAEHREECREERSRETGVQHGLNLDDRAWRTGPLWNCGGIIAESGVIYLMDEDAEESGSLFVRVRLELGVDLDDEGRGNGGEQTSLWSESTRVYPNNLQDSRISTSCSNRRRISCQMPCRTPRPPHGNFHRIEIEYLQRSDTCLVPGCERGFSSVQGGCLGDSYPSLSSPVSAATSSFDSLPESLLQSGISRIGRRR